MLKEYRTISEISGPLMLVQDVEGVKYEELVEIELASGETRRGRVLEVSGSTALVQIFEGSSGLSVQDTKVRFLGRGLELAVSMDILGRVFDGLGRPRDDGPKIIPEKRLDINGNPLNPTARDYLGVYPDGDFHHRRPQHHGSGQKLPIFSAAGLPHSRLAAQIARQAKVWGLRPSLPSSLPPWGSPEEAEFFISDFRRTGAIERSVMFMNLADDPPSSGSPPRMAHDRR